ncbi:hypothetical protein [Sorangium cellulosum]|uniref:hypothetical protein n=1 Tax=Sorangium cellulosum TaxID=56 RepID=UPI0013313F10|nr:hypothetical protein [Sorangium cellulosum]
MQEPRPLSSQHAAIRRLQRHLEAADREHRAWEPRRASKELLELPADVRGRRFAGSVEREQQFSETAVDETVDVLYSVAPEQLAQALCGVGLLGHRHLIEARQGRAPGGGVSPRHHARDGQIADDLGGLVEAREYLEAQPVHQGGRGATARVHDPVGLLDGLFQHAVGQRPLHLDQDEGVAFGVQDVGDLLQPDDLPRALLVPLHPLEEAEEERERLEGEAC